MTIEERSTAIQLLFDTQCMPILETKGCDYATNDDANSNFKHIAQTLGLSKYQIWAVYFNKHIDSINNAIKNNPDNPERICESLDNSIIAGMNYLGILHTMKKEDREDEVRRVARETT